MAIALFALPFSSALSVEDSVTLAALAASVLASLGFALVCACLHGTRSLALLGVYGFARDRFLALAATRRR